MATLAAPLLPLSETELTERRRAVESALGTTLAEGVSPSSAALALGERYALGEISLDEYIASVKALHNL